MDNFAGHSLHFDTERLRLRPFEEADFDLALPFYGDPDFLNAMEGKPPDEPVTRDYLRRAGKVMAREGFLFAIVEKASGRTIGEVCLQWMNLERAKIANAKTMRMPVGIWVRSMWGNYRSAALWRSCGMVVSRELDNGNTRDFEITRRIYESVHKA